MQRKRKIKGVTFAYSRDVYLILRESEIPTLHNSKLPRSWLLRKLTTLKQETILHPQEN